MANPKAFLSHSSGDKALAERLARDLTASGVDVWYADWEIRAGDSLRRKIDAGIEGASLFLVLLTPNSLQSEWVQTERGRLGGVKGGEATTQFAANRAAVVGRLHTMDKCP